MSFPLPGAEDIVWLVTIDGVGSPIRVATRPVAVTDASTGAVYVFAPGVVSVAMQEDIGEPGEDAPEASATVDLLDVEGYASLAAQGHRLTMRVAEVALWVDGTDWSRRDVRIRGLVRNPEWGIPGEPIQFTIAAKLWEDPSVIPAATCRVDGTTWPHVETLLPEYLGRIYPIVIGQPGVVSTTVEATGRIEGSRGIWAEHDPTFSDSPNCDGIKLIIAGHHVEIGDNGTFGGRVYTRDGDGQNEARMRVRNGFDDRGQPIAWIPWWSEWTVSAPDDQFEYDAGTTYQYSPADTDAAATYGIGDDTANNAYVTENQVAPYITWIDDIDGGMAMKWRGIALRNAADVIHWALSQTGQNVDAAAFASLRTALTAYNIDCVIEGESDGTRTNIWEWLKSNVLPMLPVSLAMGPSGVYPILWRWTAATADAEVILNVDVDPGIAVNGGIRVDDGGIRNRFTARYARSMRTGDYVGEITIGPDDYDPAAPTVLTSAVCKLSRSLYRHENGQPYVAEETIELPCVYADSTAVAVLEAMALQRALAIETMEVTAPLRTYGRAIRRGGVALVTYADLGLSSRLALIVSVSTSAEEDTVTVGLRLLPDLPTLWSAA